MVKKDGGVMVEREMSAEERLQSVINLQVPDRVPSAPMIYYFASQYAGITTYELWSDPGKYRMAIEKCYNELGPWDIYYPINPRYPEVYTFIMPMKAKWPGIDLPPESICQLLEEEVITFDDYRWIVDFTKHAPWLTYFPLFVRIISRAWDSVEEGWRGYLQVAYMLARHLAGWRVEFERWKRRGVAILFGFCPEATFDTFSLGRGLIDFVRDCTKHPEEVKRAADDLTESCVFISSLVASLMGVKRVEVYVHRSSNDFISPDTFREFSFPSLKGVVESLVARGINTILHMDGNWDLNLEILRELPAGNCVVQFDGSTDIFLAKEVIGDRICIMGDVPANMLCLGSTSEVDEYCHRLIEEVGRGGGYIMGAGCEIPPNARPENVKTMIASVERYGRYDR